MSEDLEWIPRSVRDKLDRAGIKLHLKEWTSLSLQERQSLVDLPCTTDTEVAAYTEQLDALVRRHSGYAAELIRRGAE